MNIQKHSTLVNREDCGGDGTGNMTGHEEALDLQENKEQIRRTGGVGKMH